MNFVKIWAQRGKTEEFARKLGRGRPTKISSKILITLKQSKCMRCHSTRYKTNNMVMTIVGVNNTLFLIIMQKIVKILKIKKIIKLFLRLKIFETPCTLGHVSYCLDTFLGLNYSIL